MAKPNAQIQAQIDALNAAFMDARAGGFNSILPNLTPEMLDFIASQQGQVTSDGAGQIRGYGSADGNNIFQQYGYYGNANPQGNPESQTVSRDPSTLDWQGLQYGINTDDSNHVARYGTDGRFQGYERMVDGSSYKEFITALMMMAPAIAGVYGWAANGGAAGGAGGSAAAGGGAGGFGTEGLSGMDLAADAALGTGNNITTAGSALSGGGTAGASGLDSFRQGEIANYQTNGSMPSSAATTSGNMSAYDTFVEGLKQATGTGAGSDPGSLGNTVASGLSGSGGTAATGAQVASNVLGGSGSTVGGLLGALAGYYDSKDGKQATSQNEPWSKAQPYLEGLLRDGATLYDQYRQQPYSPAEQVGYANYGGVLDYLNSNAGGLLDGFQASGSGANNFVRGGQNQIQGFSYDPATSPVSWNPQRFGNFGTTNPRR